MQWSMRVAESRQGKKRSWTGTCNCGHKWKTCKVRANKIMIVVCSSCRIWTMLSLCLSQLHKASSCPLVPTQIRRKIIHAGMNKLKRIPKAQEVVQPVLYDIQWHHLAQNAEHSGSKVADHLQNTPPAPFKGRKDEQKNQVPQKKVSADGFSGRPLLKVWPPPNDSGGNRVGETDGAWSA